MSTPYRGGHALERRAPEVPVRWIAREPPLEPRALAAFGQSARALAARLSRAGDDALAALRGVAAPDVIVVTGDASALPWVDGAHWLGRDLAAPSLLLPTALRPHVDAALFERALLRGEHGSEPLAVVRRASGLVAVSLAEARPVSRVRLGQWLEGALR